MLFANRVTLRAIERDDGTTIHAINNDVAVELAGGGDPPWPQSFARVVADFERDASGGGRDGGKGGVNFAIEADGQIIGFCGVRDVDPFGRTAELGITICDKAYGGRVYGREAIRLLLDSYGTRYGSDENCTTHHADGKRDQVDD